MQDFLAGCTMLASFAIFVLAFVALFKPLPSLGMGTRRRALRGFGVSFGLFVLTAIIMPPPKDKPATSQEMAAKDEQGVQSSASPTDVPSSPEQKAAAATFYKSLLGTLASCDEAAAATAKVVKRIQAGTASVYDGYSAATTQVSACQDSAAKARDLSTPGALGDAIAEKAEDAKEVCSNTAMAKQMAAETAQEIFDGNAKPSKMQEFTDRASLAQAGVIACAAKAMGVAIEAGVDLKDLPKFD